LREIIYNGRKLSRANNNKSPKLDRMLMYPDWEENFPLSFVYALERELSDHTPLIIDIGNHVKTAPLLNLRMLCLKGMG
jgi:hypothetical protein